jgi:hypothetical protein
MSEVFWYKVRNLPTRLRGWKAELLALLGLGINVGLTATLIRADGSRVELGVLSRRVVTTAGINYVVDAFQNLTELENFDFHDAGTGTTAENAADTTLQTPFGGSRVSGTATEPAANQYRSTATIPFTSTLAITEHGLFSASSAGTLFDRSVFTAINVVNGDSIQFEYTLTVSGS